jgi:hypothetical protein
MLVDIKIVLAEYVSLITDSDIVITEYLNFAFSVVCKPYFSVLLSIFKKNEFMIPSRLCVRHSVHTNNFWPTADVMKICFNTIPLEATTDLFFPISYHRKYKHDTCVFFLIGIGY